MTNLEFINREIKELEFQIKYIESNMKKNVDIRTELQLKIDETQLKLNSLYQIKTDLEAWEAVKRNLEHPSGDTDILAFCISPLCIDQMKDYEKIIKALEVE